MKNRNETRDDNASQEPIVGQPGAHPTGTGGPPAECIAAAGAAADAVAGTAETHVGTASGAIVGGNEGKAVPEGIDPAREDAYWRENYSERAYVEDGSSYDDYGPAYRFGVEAASCHPGRTFEDVEPELSQQWNDGKGALTLSWESARPAVRDAWNRINDAA